MQKCTCCGVYKVNYSSKNSDKFISCIHKECNFYICQSCFDNHYLPFCIINNTIPTCYLSNHPIDYCSYIKTSSNRYSYEHNSNLSGYEAINMNKYLYKIICGIRKNDIENDKLINDEFLSKFIDDNNSYLNKIPEPIDWIINNILINKKPKNKNIITDKICPKYNCLGKLINNECSICHLKICDLCDQIIINEHTNDCIHGKYCSDIPHNKFCIHGKYCKYKKQHTDDCGHGKSCDCNFHDNDCSHTLLCKETKSGEHDETCSHGLLCNETYHSNLCVHKYKCNFTSNGKHDKKCPHKLKCNKRLHTESCSHSLLCKHECDQEIIKNIDILRKKYCCPICKINLIYNDDNINCIYCNSNYELNIIKKYDNYINKLGLMDLINIIIEMSSKKISLIKLNNKLKDINEDTLNDTDLYKNKFIYKLIIDYRNYLLYDIFNKEKDKLLLEIQNRCENNCLTKKELLNIINKLTKYKIK